MNLPEGSNEPIGERGTSGGPAGNRAPGICDLSRRSRLNGADTPLRASGLAWPTDSNYLQGLRGSVEVDCSDFALGNGLERCDHALLEIADDPKWLVRHRHRWIRGKLDRADVDLDQDVFPRASRIGVQTRSEHASRRVRRDPSGLEAGDKTHGSSVAHRARHSNVHGGLPDCHHRLGDAIA